MGSQAYCSQCQHAVPKNTIECPYCGYNFASRAHASHERDLRQKKTITRTRSIVIFLVLCGAIFFYVSSRGIKLSKLWQYTPTPAAQDKADDSIDNFSQELGNNMYTGSCEVKGIIISGQTPRVKIDNWWFEEGKSVCGGKISTISISKVAVQFGQKEAKFKVGDSIEPPKR
jgi:hypothetical protein